MPSPLCGRPRPPQRRPRPSWPPRRRREQRPPGQPPPRPVLPPTPPPPRLVRLSQTPLVVTRLGLRLVRRPVSPARTGPRRSRPGTCRQTVLPGLPRGCRAGGRRRSAGAFGTIAPPGAQGGWRDREGLQAPPQDPDLPAGWSFPPPLLPPQGEAGEARGRGGEGEGSARDGRGGQGLARRPRDSLRAWGARGRGVGSRPEHLPGTRGEGGRLADRDAWGLRGSAWPPKGARGRRRRPGPTYI